MALYSSTKAFPEDIECVLDPVQGKGGIFISNVEAAQNLNTLKKHGIEAVLTAAFNVKLTHPKSAIPYYKHVPGKDHQQFNLSVYFDESVEFIDKALQKTNILVHCMAGVSRSVTLVLAFLINKKGMRYEQAHSMVKGRRRIIHPNDGFIRQLKTYEQQCKGTPSQSPSKNYGVSPYSQIDVRRAGSLYDSPLKKYEPAYEGSPLKRFYESTGKFGRYESPLKKYDSRQYSSKPYESKELEREPLHAANRFLNPERSTRGLSGLKYTPDRYSHLLYNNSKDLKVGDYGNSEDYIEKRVAEIKKKQSMFDDYRRSGHTKSKSIMENYEKSGYSPYDTAPLRDFDRLGMRKLSSMYDYIKY